MTLTCMRHVHGYLTNPKFSQDFKFVDFNQGPNYELISIYQVQPFGHTGGGFIRIHQVIFFILRSDYNERVHEVQLLMVSNIKFHRQDIIVY